MIKLSGNINTVDIFKYFKPTDMTDTEGSWKKDNYKKKWLKKIKNFDILFFLEPTKFGMPWCYIYIVPTSDLKLSQYKEFLRDLNDKLPGLNVSSVEYAVDLFGHDRGCVNHVFNIIARNIYYTYQRKVSFYGDNYVKFGKKNKLIAISNKVYDNLNKQNDEDCEEFNAGANFGENNKVYERGDDAEKEFYLYLSEKKQIDKGWRQSKLNRVRMEHTSGREELVEFGINTLPDLIKDPKFVGSYLRKDRYSVDNYLKNTLKFTKKYLKKDPKPADVYLKKDPQFAGAYLIINPKPADVYLIRDPQFGGVYLKKDLKSAKKYLKKDPKFAGIYLIKDQKSAKEYFKKDPKCMEAYKDRLKFAYLKGSNLPKFYDPYSCTDENGIRGLFQIEYINGRKIKKNPSQHRKDFPGAGKFNSKFYEAINVFTKEWMTS